MVDGLLNLILSLPTINQNSRLDRVEHPSSKSHRSQGVASVRWVSSVACWQAIDWPLKPVKSGASSKPNTAIDHGEMA